MKKKIAIAMILLNSQLAFAYIDPGTGGAILGSIWGTVVAVFGLVITFFVTFFIKPIKSWFSKIFRR